MLRSTFWYHSIHEEITQAWPGGPDKTIPGLAQQASPPPTSCCVPAGTLPFTLKNLALMGCLHHISNYMNWKRNKRRRRKREGERQRKRETVGAVVILNMAIGCFG